ncbi:SDR family oxidoreductase [Shimia sagamensis]|uniref:Saccharopine dehydrogenase NADP binding domain-containing protein n=1 Tax=Shimia sagamensis TaxID=1566352 RepID=A0ABY1P1Z4_9RHOB|nr:SDR family oxidoreductase [Shimia sagamensis]SMP23901.1 Saccharopine dehydrogenase NADP binding domain-containing protein [Shimia sagamensis]
MKIVVLGGYGVFGSRLTELLLRDGHEVTIVGRDAGKADALATRLGCDWAAFDIHRDAEKLLELKPEVVIDAAGPFQAYGADGYHVARLCIDIGADYLDLADDAAFAQGISGLDEAAKAAGRRVLSGVSSVPALSGAVAAELCRDMAQVDLIETAILPGNQAPRGASVMASILSQLGAAVPVWRGSRWQDQKGWSDARSVTLMPGLTRRARFIEVPDICLFPKVFGARSVMFRAGMELGILNWGMAIVAAVRSVWPFEITTRRLAVFRSLAQILQPFGTDRGGMAVDVVGAVSGATVRRSWRLVAEAGEGPFMPAVAARAVVRNLADIPPGARACVTEVPLKEMQAAFADLQVHDTRSEKLWVPQFQKALGAFWDRLPAAVQDAHRVVDVTRLHGHAQIERGNGLLAVAAARVFGFPKATERCQVSVTKTVTEKGEVWARDFGGHVMRSRCELAPKEGRFRERFGAFLFEMDLKVEDAEVHMPVRRAWCLGVALPKILLPFSDTREFERDGTFHFDVALYAPTGSLMVRYRGSLLPVGSDAPILQN